MGEDRVSAEAQIKALKGLRKKHSMSQRALSEYLGIPIRTIEDWESGRRRMKAYELRLILYYVSISTFLKDNDIEFEDPTI